MGAAKTATGIIHMSLNFKIVEWQVLGVSLSISYNLIAIHLI